MLVRGPQVMKEYYNDPEATAEAIDSEGWFNTGDVGYVDPDNFLYLQDRRECLYVRLTDGSQGFDHQGWRECGVYDGGERSV